MTRLYLHRKDDSIEKQTEEHLREILRRPENRYCADCRDKDPRWSSWNIGVLLCINCCGRHRGLGTHISKVKSIDLDRWQPAQVANLDLWGNHRANLYWEAKIPADKIFHVCSLPDFVRRKYEKREYVLSPTLPDPNTLEKRKEDVQVGDVESSAISPEICGKGHQRKQKCPNNFAVFPTIAKEADEVLPRAVSSMDSLKDGASGSNSADVDPFSVLFGVDPGPDTCVTNGSSASQPRKNADQDSCSSSNAEQSGNNTRWTDFYDAKDFAGMS